MGRLRRCPARAVPRCRSRWFDGGVQTTGRCRSRTSSYGERFSYLPEARPAMAVDGDPNTAWTVLDPAGQFLEITTATGVDHVTVLQPSGLRDVRRLETVTITVDGGAAQEVGARRALADHRATHPNPGDLRPDDDPALPRPHCRAGRPPRPRPSRPNRRRVRRGRRRNRTEPGVDRRSQRPHDGDARGRSRAPGDVRPHP